MLHIYRQVKSLRGVDTFRGYQGSPESQRFPFHNIEVIPKRRTNLLAHGWLKFVERRPPIVYRGEYQTLDSLLARHGADLMHIYFGHTGVHLLPFIQQWDKPCVVSFHGADVAHKEDIKDYPAKLRLLFDAVPLLFARSQSLADRLIHLGCPPEKLRINRTGVPLKEFPFVDRQPPPDGNWRIVQACRLIPKKGVATSLRAFAIFKKDNPQAEFFIAGKGPLQRELEMLAAGLGIFKDVHFLGFLSQPKLLELYSACTCLCIRAKRHRIRIRKAYQIHFSRRWRPVARAQRRGTAASGSGRARSHGLLVPEGRPRCTGECHAGKSLHSPGSSQRDGIARARRRSSIDSSRRRKSICWNRS
jgi:colanic acid/amylovoran biosynthesis glycosyltransferase